MARTFEGTSRTRSSPKPRKNVAQGKLWSNLGIQDLNCEQLEFLDLRGSVSITGNLSELKCSRLRGVYLQYTKTTGDITELLRSNRGMTWLDLRGTEVKGSINSEWLEVGQALIYLRLSDSRVTFDMAKPEIAAWLAF